MDIDLIPRIFALVVLGKIDTEDPSESLACIINIFVVLIQNILSILQVKELHNPHLLHTSTQSTVV